MNRVYFTDRDLGTRFPEILRAGGLEVRRHADLFPPACPDEVWLEDVGRRKWVAVTHDRRIHYKPNEQAAVLRHKVMLLIVVGKAPFPDLARSFLATLLRAVPQLLQKMQQFGGGNRELERCERWRFASASLREENALFPHRSEVYSVFANTECAAMLKPQDIVIIGKLLSRGDDNRAQSHIAAELQMSPSEVNAGMKRAVKSGLLRQEGSQYEPVKAAISEFLLHGLKYAFPAERGQPTRGLPTSYAAAPLNEHIAMGSDLPPVWPHPQGDTRGYELKPLYRSVPAAAKADPMLYQFLAVADALRDGAVRDKKIAEQALKVLLRMR